MLRRMNLSNVADSPMIAPLPAWAADVEQARLLALRPEGLPEARRLLESQLRAHPEAWEPLEAEVEVLVRLREDRLAERLLDEYIRCFPGHSNASARLAWVYWQQRRAEDAVAEISATTRRDPQCRQAWYWLAEWALEKQDWNGAAKAATAGLAACPDDARLHVLLAHAQLKTHQEQQAETNLKRALELQPGDVEALDKLAQALTAQNRPGEACLLLEPAASLAEAPPALWLTAADAYFRANQPVRALPYLHRLWCSPTAENDALQRRAIELGQRSLGPQEFSRQAVDLVTRGQAHDSFAVESVELHGANQPVLNELWGATSRQPLRYPRALARLISTFHRSIGGGAATIQKWTQANQPVLHHCTHLWGAVGAWLFDMRRHREAADHLASWWQRRDARPWMVQIMARALETMGEDAAANAQYRAALQMPADHSEMGLRTRLAFNMALDGYAAAGHLIVMACSGSGKRQAATDDAMRALAVEALMKIERATDAADRVELLAEGVARVTEAMGRQGGEELRAIVGALRQRGGSLVEIARSAAR